MNPDHDSLFLRFEQLEQLLEKVKDNVTVMTCGMTPVNSETLRKLVDARSLIQIIRGQVLK